MQLHPWEAETRSKSAGICCKPHSPQPRSAAWPGAKLQPISHPGVQRRHQGTVSSLAQSLRASECAVHLTVSTRRPRERKGTPGIVWARPAPPSPTVAHFPVQENSAHPLPRSASARGLDFASYGFQKSSLSSPVLRLTMQCWIYAARC